MTLTRALLRYWDRQTETLVAHALRGLPLHGASTGRGGPARAAFAEHECVSRGPSCRSDAGAATRCGRREPAATHLSSERETSRRSASPLSVDGTRDPAARGTAAGNGRPPRSLSRRSERATAFTPPLSGEPLRRPESLVGRARQTVSLKYSGRWGSGGEIEARPRAVRTSSTS
jgi:hypothetical protein